MSPRAADAKESPERDRLLSASPRRRSASRGLPAVVPARLSPPRFHQRLVRRDGIIQALLEATVPLVVVSAPAGSGKTVGLAQWAALDARPVGWLQLDSADNDQLVLLAHLVAVLDRIVGLDQELFDLLATSRRGPRREVMPRIAGALMISAPFALVLDDAHCLENRECWQHIATVLDHLPDGATLAIASRSDPPLSLARRRARADLLELRRPELALDGDEVALLLRLQGLAADDEQVDALLEATEGWATGVYLAAAAGRECAGATWAKQVRGDQREIAEYLLDEVVDRLDGDLQEFLLETSILERLTASLCAAVTGRDDAGAVLARLARENVFVAALDDHDEAFRYHHLFAELLRSRLARRRPGDVAALHEKAAAWLYDHGEPVEAVAHWLAAGDLDRTVVPVARTVSDCLTDGRVETAYRLVSSFTESQLLSRPGLAVTAGWVYAAACGSPEEQEHWTRLMRTYRFEDQSPSPDTATSLLSSYRMLMGELAPQGITQMRDDFAYCRKVETRRADDWYVMARSLYAQALYLLGKPRAAERELRDLQPDLSNEVDLAGCAALLAQIVMDEGRWDEAEVLVACATAPEGALDLDLDPAYSMYVMGQLAHLRLLSRRGDPGALEFATRVDEYAGRMVHRAPWVLLLVDVLLGEVALEQGGVERARAWVARAVGRLASYPDAGMLGRRARSLAAAVDERRFGESITPAERRVLELLPTHLSEEAIADRLCLSTNTVRTHRRALYRKLGATKRGEAVARARELGLLTR